MASAPRATGAGLFVSGGITELRILNLGGAILAWIGRVSEASSGARR
jgi:hypothetical protein